MGDEDLDGELVGEVLVGSGKSPSGCRRVATIFEVH